MSEKTVQTDPRPEQQPDEQPQPGPEPAEQVAEESVPARRTAATDEHPGAGTEPAALPLRPALEAVLMIADAPLDHTTLAQAVNRPPGEVADALAELSAEYAEQGRGFDLREVAGGWRFYTRAEFAPLVERFVLDGQQARLTQAALETLAVVAYRQPVSRGRVSAIRGVNVDGVMRTLVTRGLVEEAGSDEHTGAVVYRTTSYFLERMGLTGLDDLPDIAPLLPDMAEVEDEVETPRETLRAVPSADAGGPTPRVVEEPASPALETPTERSADVTAEPSADVTAEPSADVTPESSAAPAPEPSAVEPAKEEPRPS